MNKNKRDDLVYEVNTPEVAFREIKGEMLLLIPDSSAIHVFNETGRWIWKELLRKKKLSRIVAGYARQFKLSDAEAQRDIKRFLSLLEKRNMVIKKIGIYSR